MKAVDHTQNAGLNTAGMLVRRQRQSRRCNLRLQPCGARRDERLGGQETAMSA